MVCQCYADVLRLNSKMTLRSFRRLDDFDQSIVWFDFWSSVACSCWQYLVEDDKCYFYFTKSVRQDALFSFVLHAQ